MAREKDKNEITAEELFDKLVGKDAAVSEEKNPFSEMLSSINLTSENDSASESDLDINELLKKYLPEYGDATANEPVDMSKVMGEIDSAASKTAAEPVQIDDGILPADEDDTANEPVDMSELMGEIDSAANKTAAEPVQIGDGILTEYELAEQDGEVPAEAEDEAEGDDDVVAVSDVEQEDEASEEYLRTKSFLDKLLDNAVKADDDDDSPAADEAETDAAEDYIAEANDEESADAEENEFKMSDSLFSSAAPETEEAEGEADEEKTADAEADPLDINLMIAFDMESDDEETSSKAKIAGDILESTHEEAKVRKFELDRPEYVDKSQTAEIRNEFKGKKISLIVRSCLCAVLTILLFVFENITSITQIFTGSAKQFSGAFDPALYPVVYIMVSLQLMLLACLCALPEILDGFKHLFRGTPKPESMTGLLAVSGIIYSAVLCNLIVSPNEPVMLNFVVAFSALLTLISALLNNKREMMNFRIISSKKAKHVVRRMQEEESVCEVKAFEMAEDVCDVMKIEKTDFVENFFTRLRTPVQSNCTAVMFLTGVMVAVGVLFGIFTSFRSGSDGAFAWRAAFSAMYLVAPMSVFMAFSYPFYRANLAAKEYDSAIVGESSLEEYSNASIISFDDKNVFPSYAVKVQNIRIYNNARIDRVLYYASSVFSYAGGPLQDVFEITTKDMGTSENVQIFESESGFLATQVDGVNIIFGSYDALTARGLEIPEKAAGDDVDLSDELSIMYMFRESVLVAKMYIKYDMDEDIDVILKQFSGDGLYVCVRTFDPNIDEEMISRKLGAKKLPLKIIRYLNPSEVGKFEEKVDSGLVTCSSSKSLLQVISYCEKVIHTKKTNIALSILSIMIGAAILLLLLLANSMNILTSLIIVLYQLVWLIPTIIATKMFIR